MGKLRAPLLTLRRIVPPQAYTHRWKEIRVPRLPKAVYAQRSSIEARQTTRQEKSHRSAATDRANHTENANGQTVAAIGQFTHYSITNIPRQWKSFKEKRSTTIFFFKNTTSFNLFFLLTLNIAYTYELEFYDVLKLLFYEISIF